MSPSTLLTSLSLNVSRRHAPRSTVVPLARTSGAAHPGLGAIKLRSLSLSSAEPSFGPRPETQPPAISCSWTNGADLSVTSIGPLLDIVRKDERLQERRVWRSRWPLTKLEGEPLPVGREVAIHQQNDPHHPGEELAEADGDSDLVPARDHALYEVVLAVMPDAERLFGEPPSEHGLWVLVQDRTPVRQLARSVDEDRAVAKEVELRLVCPVPISCCARWPRYTRPRLYPGRDTVDVHARWRVPYQPVSLPWGWGLRCSWFSRAAERRVVGLAQKDVEVGTPKVVSRDGVITAEDVRARISGQRLEPAGRGPDTRPPAAAGPIRRRSRGRPPVPLRKLASRAVRFERWCSRH